MPAEPSGFWVAMQTKGVGHAVHRDGVLFHDFQQGGLRLGRGTVDLVRQQQLAVGRAIAVLKLVGLAVQHRKAGNVRGQGIRRELDTLAGQAQRLGKCQGQRGFAHAGAVLQQDMAAGVDRHQDLFRNFVFADKGLVHLGQDLL